MESHSAAALLLGKIKTVHNKFEHMPFKTAMRGKERHRKER